MVARACNPSPLESRVGRWLEVKSPRPVWPTWQNHAAENTKISQVWWRAPVILTTHEPRWRHCTPTWVTKQKSVSKKKNKKKTHHHHQQKHTDKHIQGSSKCQQCGMPADLQQHHRCCELNICVPQIHMLIPNPKCDDTWRWDL